MSKTVAWFCSSRSKEKSSIEEIIALGRPGNGLLSQVLRHSTIGAEAFDGRVRDGIGSYHSAKVTRPAKGETKQTGRMIDQDPQRGSRHLRPQITMIWDRQDGHRLMRAFKPIERLVPVSCTHCCASTPGLSTWSSSTALKGELV